MRDVSLTFTGGDILKNRLLTMARGLEEAHEVRVGFLESATYAGGEYQAQMAGAAKRAQKEGRSRWAKLFSAWAAWGESHQRSLPIAQVAFWLEFGTTRMKARPFFRSMIRSKSPRWGYWLARFLKESDYSASASLGKLGLLIQEQLRESILAWPADNKPMTVFIKRANKALVNVGTLLRHVDSEVS